MSLTKVVDIFHLRCVSAGKDEWEIQNTYLIGIHLTVWQEEKLWYWAIYTIEE